MGKNLNQDLYRRFGLELELKTVQNGFRKYIKGILITLPSPDENVLMRICKRLFLDRESYEDQFDVYESTGDFKRLIRKEFLTAQSKSKLKNSVEDMYTACDETVKIVFGDKNKGFKHIFGKTEYLRLGLNGNQKEIYKSANNWMNGIKHGSIKDFDREDVEMIISLTAAFISLVVNKLAKLKEDVSGD